CDPRGRLALPDPQDRRAPDEELGADRSRRILSTVERCDPYGAAARYACSAAEACASRCNPCARITPSTYSPSGYAESDVSDRLAYASPLLASPARNRRSPTLAFASALRGFSRSAAR